jgi:hypothetical protein
MDTYAQLVAKLEQIDDGLSSIGPQPESRIEEIESKYGIRLPRSYREFLMQVGGIDYPNHFFTSIDDDYLDDTAGFMCNTNMIRAQVGIPDGIIALEYDHDADEIACLDLNRLNGDECPVIWYHPFQGRVIRDCAKSFDEFIRRYKSGWLEASG